MTSVRPSVIAAAAILGGVVLLAAAMLGAGLLVSSVRAQTAPAIAEGPAPGSPVETAAAAVDREFRVLEQLAADPSLPMALLETAMHASGPEYDQSRDQINALRNTGTRSLDLEYRLTDAVDTGRYRQPDRIELSGCIQASGTKIDAHGSQVQPRTSIATENLIVVSTRDLAMEAIAGPATAPEGEWKVFSTTDTSRPC